MSQPQKAHVVVPDLGIGNLASIVNMVKHCGFSAQVVDQPSGLDLADRIILAGVGAYDAAMAAVMSGGWRGALDDHVVNRGKPVLGFCLGMQLLCRTSEEGLLPGLGWFDAEVQRFCVREDDKVKVPHMGWSEVRPVRNNPLLPDNGQRHRFYFAHSYHVVCASDEDVAAVAHHGYEFAAFIHRGNMMGLQFHPEKSHRFGMDILKRFLVL